MSLSPDGKTSVCRNCIQLESSHVDQKCPFETTNFVAMTREELLANNEKEQIAWKQEMLGTWPAPHRTSICKHCLKRPQEHLEDGKCIFEASYFELLRVPMKEG